MQVERVQDVNIALRKVIRKMKLPSFFLTILVIDSVRCGSAYDLACGSSDDKQVNRDMIVAASPERHTSDPAHGDLCRLPNMDFFCVNGCHKVSIAPWCVLTVAPTSPCRITSADAAVDDHSVAGTSVTGSSSTIFPVTVDSTKAELGQFGSTRTDVLPMLLDAQDDNDDEKKEVTTEVFPYFFHVPKAAGSTVAVLLAKKFRMRTLPGKKKGKTTS